MLMLAEKYAQQCGENIVPDILDFYSNNQETVALVHFVTSNITKLGIYDMLEHVLLPWSVDYDVLEIDYHDNLSYCIDFLNRTRPTPPIKSVEDVVIWVGFRSNPGYWYGKGDASTGFVLDGILPYDENENFILDSYPDQRTTPSWVFEFINEQMILD